ncbi:MAG: peptidylprolyl isomerase [Candidatus Korobacteraceae bacterium]
MFSLVLALILAPGLVFAQQSTVIEEIVARVNNAIITRVDLARGQETMVDEVNKQAPGKAEAIIKNREPNVLRDLIDQQLLLQKAQDLGISGDVELVKRLDEIRKQMGATSMEDMDKLARQQGVSFEDFKQNLKNNIISQQVISREVGSRIQISQSDAQKYYAEHRAELDRPEEERLSEILISSTTSPGKDSDQATSEARAKAEDLLKQLRAGTLFQELARANSNGPTAAQGGDLGYFKRGMLAKELEDKTFGLKPGEITDVIPTKQGFVILKVTEHNASGVPPLDKIQGQIQEMLYVERVQPALRVYLTKLREDAYIDVRQGFVDTGASPNQSKPIFTTASSDDSTKSKKHKNKSKKHFGAKATTSS